MTLFARVLRSLTRSDVSPLKLPVTPLQCLWVHDNPAIARLLRDVGRSTWQDELAPLAEATPIAEADAGPPSAASRVRTARPTSSA